MVHARGELGDVGQADAECVKRLILFWRDQARRQPDLVQRAPEFVLGMGVIGSLQRRLPPGGGAAEHQVQPGPEPFRQHMILSPSRHDVLKRNARKFSNLTNS